MTHNDIDLPNLTTQIMQLVHDRYVLDQEAPAIAASLADLPSDLSTQTPDRIAEVLTRRLQRTNKERHLKVSYRPTSSASRSETAYETKYAAEARHNAGGMRQVRLLDDGVGMLTVAPYLSPVHLAKPYITAAFTLLASARALIIDLRDGHGGTPETVALICGHLLGKEPAHLQDIVGRGQQPRQFWTTPAATRIDTPIAVLTSNTTFSGCEELAYNHQALHRAIIVGQRTRGGAHPVQAFTVARVFELNLPIARSVNTVTGTNWEQIGVTPDRPCPPAEALEVALGELRTKRTAASASS